MTSLPFHYKRWLACAALLACAGAQAQMAVTSPAFAANGVIPDPFTFNDQAWGANCRGSNWSPPLEITGIPAGTKQLAIEMRDRTVPTLHWKVWGIPVSGTSVSLPLNAAETYAASSAINEYPREPGYGGPCPPAGAMPEWGLPANHPHRYEFTVYAMTTAIGSGEPSTGSLAAVPANRRAVLVGVRAANDSRPWTPPAATHVITATASPTAGGSVTCTPNPVPNGGSATCTASANAGYTFDRFEGDCSGATCTLTNVTAAKSVTARFNAVPAVTHAITATAAPVEGGNVTCTPNPVTNGGAATCTATSNPGFVFTAFSGDCTGSACNLRNVTAPKNVTATFAATHAITAVATPVAGGSVTCTPNPVTNGDDANCTATPNPGFVFTAFSGDCTGDTCALSNVTSAKNVTATFAAVHSITAEATPTAGGSVTCTPNPVTNGGDANCTATPNPGFVFTAFSGDCTGDACVLNNVTAPKRVTASFAARMAVTSPAFAADGVIPDPFTFNDQAWGANCRGSNWSPPLEITGIPAGTKQLAIEMRDRTVPTLHWKVWGIPVSGTSVSLPLNAAETYAASSAINQYPGEPGYGGPCPPSDALHTYEFTVYALTTDVGSGEPSEGELAAVPVNNQASLQGRRARNSSQPWTHAITATANPTAGGSVTCTPSPVPNGGSATCTASANAGYTFDRFEGDCSGATCTLTNVTAAKSVTARFRANATPNPTPDPTPTPPAATVPAKPTDFKAVAGNKQVQLQWAAPSSDGGKPVSGYEVKVKNHASLGCTTKPGVTSCTIAGLTNGKTYTFQVMARNSVGQGPAASVEATPKADVSEPPKKPEGVTAQAGDGQVQVRWKAADAQAGVTGYAVRVKGQADLGCTATAQADHCIVKGLDNGQSYTLEIVALNAKGASAPASMMVRPVVTPLPEALGEVQKLYIAYYQRPADPAGLLFWEKKAREAGSMAKVVEAFADSREARRLYGKIDKGNIGKVIDKVYQALYNTKPDAKGKQHYEQGFAQGRYTAASIVLDILNGAKGEAHMAAVGNKMEAAAMFVRLLDPELDGSKVQATYDEKDEAAARHWLAGITSRATTTQSKTKAFIVQKLASPKDPIAQKSDK